jgi:hypothetical protein
MNLRRVMLVAAVSVCCSITTARAQGPVLLQHAGPIHSDPAGADRTDPASQPADDARAKIQAAVPQVSLVFTATVLAVAPLGQTNSVPPSVLTQVTLKDPTAIKGQSPDALNVPLTFTISVRAGQDFQPAADKKLLIFGDVVLAGPIMGGPPTLPGQGQPIRTRVNVSLMVEATDANVALAKKTAGPNTPEGKLEAAVRSGELVFTATVDKLVMYGTVQPPIQQLVVKDVVMLKGEVPTHLDCRYPRTASLPFNPDLNQKILCAAHPEPKEATLPPNSVSGRHTGPLPMLGGNGPEVFFMVEATDANIALARAAAKAATSAPEAAGSTEIKLFAEENWYKDQGFHEQEFAGKLEAVPQAGGASTLMRTSYYRLGSRMIYTSGKKVAALDVLVGKNVVIRGKPYYLALEGQAVSEIWPAAIRESK